MAVIRSTLKSDRYRLEYGKLVIWQITFQFHEVDEEIVLEFAL